MYIYICMHTLCICEISYGYERQNPYSCEGIQMRRYPNARVPCGLSQSSVRFRLKPDTSNSHEFELHIPSNKGTKLLLKVIKAIIIIPFPWCLRIWSMGASSRARRRACLRFQSFGCISELCLELSRLPLASGGWARVVS